MASIFQTIGIFLLAFIVLLSSAAGFVYNGNYRVTNHVLNATLCNHGHGGMPTLKLRILPYYLACNNLDTEYEWNDWEKLCSSGPQNARNYSYYICWQTSDAYNTDELKLQWHSMENANFADGCNEGIMKGGVKSLRGIALDFVSYKDPNSLSVVVNVRLRHSYSSETRNFSLRKSIKKQMDVEESESEKEFPLMTLDLLGNLQTLFTQLAINNGTGMVEFGGKRCHQGYLYDGAHIWDKIDNQFEKICFASLDIAKYLDKNFARGKEPLFILSVKDYADRDFCNMINLYEKQENRRLIPNHPDHCPNKKPYDLREILGHEWYDGLKRIMPEIHRLAKNCNMGPPPPWVNISEIVDEPPLQERGNNGPDADILLGDIILPLKAAKQTLEDLRKNCGDNTNAINDLNKARRKKRQQLIGLDPNTQRNVTMFVINDEDPDFIKRTMIAFKYVA